VSDSSIHESDLNFANVHSHDNHWFACCLYDLSVLAGSDAIHDMSHIAAESLPEQQDLPISATGAAVRADEDESKPASASANTDDQAEASAIMRAS